jgi:hypothetical protein
MVRFWTHPLIDPGTTGPRTTGPQDLDSWGNAFSVQIGPDSSRQVQMGPVKAWLIRSYLEWRGCAEWSYLELSGVVMRLW